MISFAITAFNEMSDLRRNGQRIIDCIRPAQSYDAIDEIVIVDDCSKDFLELQTLLKGEPKVWLAHNANNLGVFANKIEAIMQATNEWVITCDSDNIMDASYLDRLLPTMSSLTTWYCASFARPAFSYRKLTGVYNSDTLSTITGEAIFPCFFNTGNQATHRDSFANVFEQYRGKRADLMMPNHLNLSDKERESHYYRLVFDACDSFILNMEWILAGNQIHIVDGLEYDHHYAHGDEGNYGRSPVEKDKLGRILLSKLLTALQARSEV